MREKWTERLTGNSYWAGEATGAEYKNILAQLDEKVDAVLPLMKTDSADVLFSDLLGIGSARRSLQ